jgi:8-oxo-dGTP pyrophosphatase MutT (NUDIX family)
MPVFSFILLFSFSEKMAKVQKSICTLTTEYDMLSETFIKDLKSALNQPLPGENAQYKLAPSYRPRLTQEQINGLDPKIGAVMLLLYLKNGQWTMAFTQRHSYDGVHSGQISFPGGKKDAEDKSLIDTALRETYEEIGVSPDNITILGSLTKLFIPPSNFLVYPAVGCMEYETTFKPQEREVAEILEIPVAFFLQEENIQQTAITLPNGATFNVPAFMYNNRPIWGATAIILSEFRSVIASLTLS